MSSSSSSSEDEDLALFASVAVSADQIQSSARDEAQKRAVKASRAPIASRPAAATSRAAAPAAAGTHDAEDEVPAELDLISVKVMQKSFLLHFLYQTVGLGVAVVLMLAEAGTSGASLAQAACRRQSHTMSSCRLSRNMLEALLSLCITCVSICKSAAPATPDRSGLGCNAGQGTGHPSAHQQRCTAHQGSCQQPKQQRRAPWVTTTSTITSSSSRHTSLATCFSRGRRSCHACR